MNNTPDMLLPKPGSIFFRGVPRNRQKRREHPRENSGRENSSSIEEKCGRHEPEGNKNLLPREPEAITVHADNGA
jgi:hypothetical protein